ncbi:tRNA1(Val) (adenine(37)-N6)-methyltransferase [Galbibacter pacificus]|uniref:tRNA1(Val) (adenine(37)-N6)-methyltransferase n=1 Tax=Galbibacter pacificus TaxID=2996052 RepID=A0ABT6FSI0_9FLAO|nr:methyltransferase [Galbibacter pacificus]MDG3582661.1 methyltransferase [Galbibacter pacificus]MDG3586220.1 methyltransferase [Galbibacter pacificus]
MAKKPFQFKQFSIYQDRCAMKVGTDGVLLGAWASLERQPFSVLDIGAGTGLLSLMMAQRSTAELIDAIEIDDNAYEQCTENFEASAWNDRLFCYHAGFDEFVDEIDDKYDLIISNPPFYSEAVTSGSMQRDVARNNFSLPFDELMKGVAKLLDPKGTFNVVVPYKEEANFREIASKYKLFPSRITHVKGNVAAETKRSLLEFTFSKLPNCVKDELVIEHARHEYTADYVQLTKDFYLKM